MGNNLYLHGKAVLIRRNSDMSNMYANYMYATKQRLMKLASICYDVCLPHAYDNAGRRCAMYAWVNVNVTAFITC